MVYTPVVETDYEHYREPQNNPKNGDFVESITHRGQWNGNPWNTTPLERVSYVWGPVGEPTRVSWHNGGTAASVTVGYTPTKG